MVELRFLAGLSKRLPDDPRVLRPLGDLYTSAGQYDEGLAIDRRLISLCPDDAEVWYNLGCSLALVGEKDHALDILGEAVARGYIDVDWMGRDEDLLPLHDDPRFDALMNRIRSGKSKA